MSMTMKNILVAFGAAMAVAVAWGGAAVSGKSAVSFTWYGQSCFMISAPGVTIVTDPYDNKMDYPDLKLKADVVTISHEHFDHNNANGVSGNPVVLRGLKADGGWAKVGRKVKGAEFRTVGTFHDASEGKERGRNAVFVIKAGGLRIAHLGDLGTALTAAQVKEIGAVDVALVPVGGYYTIDAAGAEKAVRALKPRAVVAMHFKTAGAGKLPISDEKEFVKLFKNVKRAGHRIELSPETLPKEMTVYVMKYE